MCGCGGLVFGGNAFLCLLRQFLIKVLLLGSSEFFPIGHFSFSRALFQDRGHNFIYQIHFFDLSVRLFIKIAVKLLTPKAFFKISRTSIFVFKLAFYYYVTFRSTLSFLRIKINRLFSATFYFYHFFVNLLIKDKITF